MDRRTLTNFVLPFAIFPSLFAIGCKFMYVDHLAGGLDKTINALCLPSSPLSPSTLNLTASGSYVREYTYIRAIDTNEIGPCHIVAYFQLLLDAPMPLPSEFLTYLLGTGLPCVLVIWIESYRYRGKQHWLLSYPTFWLLMTQLATIGITFPVFWLLLITSRRDGQGMSGATPVPSSEGRSQAQALAFGLVLGAVIPSVAMIIVDDPSMTLVWQGYPVYVSALRALYYRCAQPRKTSSAYQEERKKDAANRKHEKQRQTTVRAIYIGTFLLSTFMHIRVVLPLLWRSDFEALAKFIIPIRAPPTDTHPSVTALNFLKWDYVLGYFTFLLGLLWSAKSVRQVTTMLLSYVATVPVTGMGGATMIILCWRDKI